MKTNIGGNRLGSGNKQEVHLRNYERSTHDLSYAWRSTIAPGTLVPFLSKVALPGDSWDIDLNCDIMTLPTIGPLFGSFKVQLDVFQVPMRLYNAALHMNKIGIGMEMDKIYFPRIQVRAFNPNHADNYKITINDNSQINPSSIYKYLGISGIGRITDTGTPTRIVNRQFNAIPILAYWDIYKNYYANKQEEKGYTIHGSTAALTATQAPESGILQGIFGGVTTHIGEICNPNGLPVGPTLWTSMVVSTTFVSGAKQPSLTQNSTINLLQRLPNGASTWETQPATLTTSGTLAQVKYTIADTDILVGSRIRINPEGYAEPLVGWEMTTFRPKLTSFDLKNIDTMREKILQQNPQDVPFDVNAANIEPYSLLGKQIVNPRTDASLGLSIQSTQEGLAIKTYQSDLFNNWIQTEWIDGDNGINAITAIDTTEGSFTMDSLNLAQKVYVMLNRIAISGGSYDDWLNAVYTHERAKGIESPQYLGSLIKELAFEEVISTAGAETDGTENPLGTLAGRGRMTGKHKGGKIRVRVDEPSYIMGIISLTPRIDYSQGNTWDTGLNTLNDLHKPALDGIGYQDLITEQMAWQSTEIIHNGTNIEEIIQKSAGKQPAWINYMTSYNQTFGNFAEENKEMFMTLNRRYDINQQTGEIDDLTTYIDPTKYNHIFAQTSIDAMNFWAQIGVGITARRKMSAKIIPNL